MWTQMLSTKTFQVIVGPIEQAAAFAKQRRMQFGEYIIVTDADELHQMDPPSIAAIFEVQAHRLGKQAHRALRDEIALLKALWPVRVQVVTR